MVVTLDENILIAIAGGIFIPLFIFFIKLIIEIGGIKTRLDSLCQSIKEHKEMLTNIQDILTDIRIIKLRLDILEKEFATRKNNNSRGAPSEFSK